MKHFLFSFLLFISAAAAAQDTAGVYNPMIVSRINAGPTFITNVHFMQVDSEVVVYGRFTVGGGTVPGSFSLVEITVPIPSDFSTPPFTTTGQMTIHENGVNPVPGSMFTNTAGTLTFKWKPSTTLGGNNDFNFAYTIKVVL